MLNFPEVDPIPLPAPVWLFKTLHILTLGFHFAAVQMLLGGLLTAVVLSFLAKKGTSPAINLKLTAASILGKRLPVVMTFLINFGVPPLLFAQVLYGRALYTSSILIGTYWLAVIPLLILCYWLLYQFSYRLEAGKTCWWIGLLSWLLAGSIAKIYSTNMTLMLRPEVWNSMYQASALGVLLPPHDPTILPRWFLMLSGGLMVSGLWMIWLAPSKNLATETQSYLQKIGGSMTAFFALIYGNATFFVYNAQPTAVKAGLLFNPLYQGVVIAWLILLVSVLIIGIASCTGKLKPSRLGRWSALLLGLLLTFAWVIFRDGIRDVTLSLAGFDVWDRAIATNWSVVGIFLGIFVLGLILIGWLVSVVMRAQPIQEEVSL